MAPTGFDDLGSRLLVSRVESIHNRMSVAWNAANTIVDEVRSSAWNGVQLHPYGWNTDDANVQAPMYLIRISTNIAAVLQNQAESVKIHEKSSFQCIQAVWVRG